MLNDFKEALVSKIAAEAQIISLLAPGPAIFQGNPSDAVELPRITFRVDHAPVEGYTYPGCVKIELRLDIWSETASESDAILEALEDILFYAHRTGALDADSYRVGYVRRTSAKSLPSGLISENGLEIERRETAWRFTLLNKTAQEN